MLMFARTGQWGALPALEEQYSDMIDRLKAIEPLKELDELQSARKYRLLSRINSNHAEIFRIVMPQLSRLSAVLRNLEQQRTLHKAYHQANDVLL
jgi:hypothetical protein